MYKKTNCIHNPATGREQTMPQVIPRAATPGRRVVVVGGGPGGLEAARVAAERGHRVVLFEAGPKLGGQLLLATRASWRRDLIAIVDWRAAELARLGVDVRLDRWAAAAEVAAERPDAVIVATGGMPDTGWLEGGELVTTTWDVLGNAAAAKDDVLVYDGIGRPPGGLLRAASGRAGKDGAFRHAGRHAGRGDGVQQPRRLSEALRQRGIGVTADHALLHVRRAGNGLEATFKSELTGEIVTRSAAQVIVEHGTVPVDEVFAGLRAGSCNAGTTDMDRLLAGVPQQDRTPDGGAFELHRIGDAVTSRGVHAAIYDAARLCMAL